MRFIILLILIILSGLAYYIMDSRPIGLAPEAVHVTQKVISEGNGSVPKHRAMLKQARLIETRAHVVENVPTQGYESGVSEWSELGPIGSLTGHQLFPKGISYKKCERFLKDPSRAGAFFAYYL